ncbi:MAG: hypothetical protein ACLU80_08475 [Dorea sp.]
MLGLEEKGKTSARTNMSGRSAARVSIGRALINEPAFILADGADGKILIVKQAERFWIF